jgi:hypothetical protein
VWFVLERALSGRETQGTGCASYRGVILATHNCILPPPAACCLPAWCAQAAWTAAGEAAKSKKAKLSAKKKPASVRAHVSNVTQGWHVCFAFPPSPTWHGLA